MWLLQSPVNPKPCGTFSWPTSKNPFSPFLWLQSLSCCLSRVARSSTPKPHGPLYSPSEPRGPFPHFRTTWTSIYLLASESHGSLLPSETHGLLPIYFWSHVVSSFFPQNLVVLPLLLQNQPCGPLSLWLPCLGLNPRAHLPLQPHF